MVQPITRAARHLAPLGLLSVAAGCGTVSSTRCVETVHEVEDHEPLFDGYTVDAIVASLPVGLQVPGTWSDGTNAEVSFTAARGSGAAQWVESERVTVEKQGNTLFSSGTTFEEILCEDYVRFPLDLSLSTDDEAVDVDVQLTATAMLETYFTFGADRMDAPPDLDGLPPFEERFGDRTGPDGAALVPDHAYVSISFRDDRVWGHLGWLGEESTSQPTGSDDVMGWMEPLLEFGESR